GATLLVDTTSSAVGLSSSRATTLSGTGSATIDVEGSNGLTVNGAINGGAALTKVGPGMLTLANSGNSFGGGLNINAGVVAAASDTALGSGGIGLSNGGTLQLNAALTSSKSITIGAGGGAINTGSNNVTIS